MLNHKVKFFISATSLIALTATLYLLGINPSFSNEKEPKPQVQQEVPKDFATQDAGAAGLRAGDILNSCKDYFVNQFRSTENIARKATCNGYFFGVGSTLLSLQTETDTNICLPSNVSTQQIIQAFLEWGKTEGLDLKIPASEGTLAAMRKKYPCY